MNRAASHVTEEAADWLLRLDEDDAGLCHTEFVAWLRQSPRHMDEFLMVETTYRTIERFFPRERAVIDQLLCEAASDVVPLHAAPQPECPPPAGASSTRPLLPRRRLLWAAMVFPLLICSAFFAAYFLQNELYETAIGEQRAFKLPDGSLLNLNTHSRVEIDFSATVRNVRLLEGEALFTVKPDSARPFRVATETAVVQAVGTAFNVYRRAADITSVAVVEGRVKVFSPRDGGLSAGQPPAAGDSLLGVGEEAQISRSAGIVRSPQPDVTQAVAWRERRLVFRGTTLREVLNEFNRYNADLKLMATDPELLRRRITATFDADDPRAFVRFLGEDPSVELNEENTQVWIRSRAAQGQ
jgi:transmembrane sensor